jgi:hypothetical protein
MQTDSKPKETSTTEAWYVVYTKPRQEDIALINLERQGYQCYLPKMRIERIRRKKAVVLSEPMFPRYLFIRLDSSEQGKSWSPIRSTLGVARLVRFGTTAATTIQPIKTPSSSSAFPGRWGGRGLLSFVARNLIPPFTASGVDLAHVRRQEGSCKWPSCDRQKRLP